LGIQVIQGPFCDKFVIILEIINITYLLNTKIKGPFCDKFAIIIEIINKT